MRIHRRGLHRARESLRQLCPRGDAPAQSADLQHSRTAPHFPAMRAEGLEPTCPKAPRPKRGAATNYATRAGKGPKITRLSRTLNLSGARGGRERTSREVGRERVAVGTVQLEVGERVVRAVAVPVVKLQGNGGTPPACARASGAPRLQQSRPEKLQLQRVRRDVGAAYEVRFDRLSLRRNREPLPTPVPRVHDAHPAQRRLQRGRLAIQARADESLGAPLRDPTLDLVPPRGDVGSASHVCSLGSGEEGPEPHSTRTT